MRTPTIATTIRSPRRGAGPSAGALRSISHRTTHRDQQDRGEDRHQVTELGVVEAGLPHAILEDLTGLLRGEAASTVATTPDTTTSQPCLRGEPRPDGHHDQPEGRERDEHDGGVDDQGVHRDPVDQVERPPGALAEHRCTATATIVAPPADPAAGSPPRPRSQVQHSRRELAGDGRRQVRVKRPAPGRYGGARTSVSRTGDCRRRKPVSTPLPWPERVDAAHEYLVGRGHIDPIVAVSTPEGRHHAGDRRRALRDRLRDQGVHLPAAGRAGPDRRGPPRRPRRRTCCPEGTRLARGVAAITLEHLACHRSGLPRLPPGVMARSMSRTALADPYADIDEDRLIAALARTRVRGTPGRPPCATRTSGSGCSGCSWVGPRGWATSRRS